MVQCEYLGYKFALSAKEFTHLKSLSVGLSVDYESGKSYNGVPTVEIKGVKPQSLSVSYQCVASLGDNPYNHYKAWKKKLGRAGIFYLGSHQFGVDVFTLKKVSMNDAKLTNRGEFITGEIVLDLEQDIVSK